MRALQQRLRKSNGFTMVEMLIVVAIIAILVTVSIPMFNSALERARCAVDAANERAAIGLAASQYLTGSITARPAGTPDSDTGSAYLYQVDNSLGVLVQWDISMEQGTAYGQCSKHGHSGKYLWVQVLDDDTIRLAWAEKPGGTNGIIWNKDLCRSTISSTS